MAASDEQREVLDFLNDPVTHGGEKPATVETHGAVVFLLKDRVYKLKRAVRFSFMDFSTAERRRAACRAEINLNRRTAPDLYLGTVPVRRSGGGELSLGDIGSDPDDWIETLVLMRRFADTFADSYPTEQELVRVAEDIAGFHARAPFAPGAGGADKTWRILEGNLTSIGRATGVDSSLLSGLSDALRAIHEKGAAELDDRAASGFVRDCHGDLHLANICRFRGVPTLFDCIDFIPDFSRIDTLYDLAFLLMDLDAHGMKSGSSRVLNRYLECRPEEMTGLSLLPLFLSMRAQVRAKVAFAAMGLADDTAIAAEKGQEAARYLSLARDYLGSGPVLLIAVGGASGTGKSTLSRAVAATKGAVILRSDAIRKRRLGLVRETDRLPPDAYSSAVSQAVYAEMGADCQTVLAEGMIAIADATFTHSESRESIETVARAAGVPFLGIWLELPENEAADRVESRRNDVSDATPDVVHGQFKHDWGTIDWHRIDARLSTREQCELVEALLPVAVDGC